jgi:7-carboxy-7-deazaguanine synthase
MKIHGIFQSINGEVTSAVQGSICTFIRLQGCHAKCSYCDTPDSQDPYGGEEMGIDEICERVKNLRIKTRYITITGGEPLEQEKDLMDLLRELKQRDPARHISLETNGLLLVQKVISWTDCVVMDYKLQKITDTEIPNKNLKLLSQKDWLKIPIQNVREFVAALQVKNLFNNSILKPRIAFSAVAPLTSKQLLSWMFEQKVTDVILNVQIHKLIGVV